MCGRYTLAADREAVAGRFGLLRLPDDLPRRCNIAPSQEALVIVAGDRPTCLQPVRSSPAP